MTELQERLQKLTPQRLVLLVTQLQARLEANNKTIEEPVAIVGMGCRLPGGVVNPEQFWQLLLNGVDAITEVPEKRWDADTYYDSAIETPGKASTRWGGFLQDVETFDAGLFKISGREAFEMDPQQRLLLEVSWEALEEAGETSNDLAGSRTGVFIGIGHADYHAILTGGDPAAYDSYTAIGKALSIASGRISYAFDLKGPSLSIDTACSSSLVAIHQAVTSLRRGECRLALAGGVNLMLSPEVSIMLSKAGMMAPDGRCKTFDAAADGFVRGEGCAIVALKRLSDALVDGNPVYAVIRGSAVNQDGRSNGLTAPNGPAQETVIREALHNAGLEPGDVSFVETHGTGTALGDPIEVIALDAVYSPGRAPDRPLRLGSVKTNIGHLESAAGVAGLLKAVLALKYGVIPPTLHQQHPNPLIPWNELNVEVPSTPEPWRPGDRKVAAVSSFGFSGTNAHVILEAPIEHVEEPQLGEDRTTHVFCLSANSEQALRQYAEAYTRFLPGLNAFDWPDACYTLETARRHWEYRLGFAASNPADAIERLNGFIRNESGPELKTGRAREDREIPKIAFLFTGQGAQYAGMGHRLYESAPVFRESMDRCEAVFRPLLGESILDIMWPESVDNPVIDSRLEDTRYTQPVLFALEWSLTRIWDSWGIRPDAVIGHSLGEYAAAVTAGVLTLENAACLVHERGRLMAGLGQNGAMLSVFASEARVRSLMSQLDGSLSIAAINGKERVVLSGPVADIESFAGLAERIGIEVKRLSISVAGHSVLVEPVLNDLECAAGALQHCPASIPFVSNVTGEPIRLETAEWPGYWSRQTREPVRFADGISALERLGCTVFLEIGPHSTLAGLAQAIVPGDRYFVAPSLRRGQDDWSTIGETIAGLYVRGVDFDWKSFEKPYKRKKVFLPTYLFERDRYWPDEPRLPRSGKTHRIDRDRLCERVHWQATQAPIGVNLEEYVERFPTLDRIAMAYIRRVINHWGLIREVGTSIRVNELMREAGIKPCFQRLIRRWLSHLEREGDISWVDTERIKVKKVCTVPDISLLSDETRRVFVGDPVLPEYVDRCGDVLTDVLTGRVNPIETLFPDGSLITSAYLYENGPLSRYFNGLIRATFESVRLGAREAAIRVLEIGAGTGGTTSALVPVLDNDIEYWFTDVSDFFIERAKDRFAGHGRFHFGLLDIDRPVEPQGHSLHGFDVVVAANVLHATRNVDDTLDRVRSLLAPGGILVLYETIRHPIWFDMTIGLIEGWNLHEDDSRKDNPLLDIHEWNAALLRAGFEKVDVFPSDRIALESLTTRLFVAWAPENASRHVVARQAAVQVGGRANPRSSLEPSVPDSFRKRLDASAPSERYDRLLQEIQWCVSRVLRHSSAGSIDVRARLMDLGLDSLMAIDLRVTLITRLCLDPESIPSTLMFDYPTIEAIARYLGPLLDVPVRSGRLVPNEPTGCSADVLMNEEDETPEELELKLKNKLDSLNLAESTGKVP